MTDGVVEARSRSGEMYGFSRTAGIATQGADEIATAAQAFGQEDDITVLTIRRAGLRSGPSLDETAAIVADSGS
jgi:serine phosphatase RsbU (regulator of sigma subunit)